MRAQERSEPRHAQAERPNGTDTCRVAPTERSSGRASAVSNTYRSSDQASERSRPEKAPSGAKNPNRRGVWTSTVRCRRSGRQVALLRVGGRGTQLRSAGFYCLRWSMFRYLSWFFLWASLVLVPMVFGAGLVYSPWPCSVFCRVVAQGAGRTLLPDNISMVFWFCLWSGCPCQQAIRRDQAALGILHQGARHLSARTSSCQSRTQMFGTSLTARGFPPTVLFGRSRSSLHFSRKASRRADYCMCGSILVSCQAQQFFPGGGEALNDPWVHQYVRVLAGVTEGMLKLSRFNVPRISWPHP